MGSSVLRVLCTNRAILVNTNYAEYRVFATSRYNRRVSRKYGMKFESRYIFLCLDVYQTTNSSLSSKPNTECPYTSATPSPLARSSVDTERSCARAAKESQSNKGTSRHGSTESGRNGFREACLGESAESFRAVRAAF